LKEQVFSQIKKGFLYKASNLKKKRETEKGFELKSEVERKKCLFLQDRFYKSKQNEKLKQKKTTCSILEAFSLALTMCFSFCLTFKA